MEAADEHIGYPINRKALNHPILSAMVENDCVFIQPQVALQCRTLTFILAGCCTGSHRQEATDHRSMAKEPIYMTRNGGGNDCSVLEERTCEDTSCHAIPYLTLLSPH